MGDPQWQNLLMSILYFMLNVNVGFSYRYLSPTDGGNDQSEKLKIRNNFPRANEVPHHALVMYSNLYCSGSLVTSRIVVTAATCLHKYSGDALVKVGSDTITGFGQIISIVAVKIHEYYKHTSELDNDIALIVLKSSVVFGENVAKIPLIESDTALYEGTSVQVSGWGGNDLPSKYADSLLLSHMVTIDKSQCQEIHGSLITESNFCANYSYEQRLSDNGGGAVYNKLLVGVLSYGASENEECATAIFTNVSYFYKWLKKNTLTLLDKYCFDDNYLVHSVESHEYD